MPERERERERKKDGDVFSDKILARQVQTAPAAAPAAVTMECFHKTAFYTELKMYVRKFNCSCLQVLTYFEKTQRYHIKARTVVNT